jgi:hypothetical protein
MRQPSLVSYRLREKGGIAEAVLWAVLRAPSAEAVWGYSGMPATATLCVPAYPSQVDEDFGVYG